MISTTPADMATQVYDEAVTVQFSEPIDQAGFEADMAGGSDFVWNGAGDEVSFTYAYPFESTAVPHTIVIPGSLEDLAGNAMGDDHEVDVTMAALIEAVLEYDASLTGNRLEMPVTSGTWFNFGDNEDDIRRYGGVSFPMGTLPGFGTVLGVREAHFKSQIISIRGNPNETGVGGFAVDHVSYTARAEIDDPTVLQAAFDTIYVGGGITPGDAVELDVADRIASSWGGGASNFQLRFSPVNVTQNGIEDVVFFRRGEDENDGLVAPGLAEPDATMRSRIELSYFQ